LNQLHILFQLKYFLIYQKTLTNKKLNANKITFCVVAWSGVAVVVAVVAWSGGVVVVVVAVAVVAFVVVAWSGVVAVAWSGVDVAVWNDGVRLPQRYLYGDSRR
jgi:hypothetical protein